ncbi:hypothetical protein [Modicisalibacter ilicicola]|uniref:hypothetical protein n=1 Tax=Modicisalibacter ilicicola TaxID=480814 RepID=UPI0015877C88|nr:hypothetical protein [Halomonas ilicicola]
MTTVDQDSAAQGFSLAAQGFLPAQGLAAHGFLVAQGFFVAQGLAPHVCCAAQGFLAAQGLAAPQAAIACKAAPLSDTVSKVPAILETILPERDREKRFLSIMGSLHRCCSFAEGHCIFQCLAFGRPRVAGLTDYTLFFYRLGMLVPLQGMRIESRLKHGLYDHEIRRKIEVTRSEKRIIPPLYSTIGYGMAL